MVVTALAALAGPAVASAQPPVTDSTVGLVTALPGSTDLAVTQAASPNPVADGQPVTYTITAHNAGPDDATGVTVTAQRSGGTLESGSSAECTDGAGGVVTCDVGALAAGPSAQSDLKLTLDSRTRGIGAARVARAPRTRRR